MAYPGSKNGAGVYQAIINNMPPHDLYIEPFVGSGAILLRKKPAASSIVIDADAAVAKRWSTIAAAGQYPNLLAICGDARSLIAGYVDDADRRALIYCDPPYVRVTRRQAKALYKHEFTDADHEKLLELLRTLKCRVMLSGYVSPLYLFMLSDWRRVDIRTMTRGGPAVESLWCNFKRPAQLHDMRYLGADFRERERIKRKKARWRARLERLDPLERRAIMEALRDLAASESTMPPGAPAASPTPAMPARATGGGGGGDFGQPRLI